jgi:hypothetical protein
MIACPCHSSLNFAVCRVTACGFSGRFIDSAPFIAGAVAILVSGAITRFTTDRLFNRRRPDQADAADFADFVSESTGLVSAFLVFIIGVAVVASGDNLTATTVLAEAIIVLPLGWMVWSHASRNDPYIAVRQKRGHTLGWRSYTMAAVNIAAVILVFLVI